MFGDNTIRTSLIGLSCLCGIVFLSISTVKTQDVKGTYQLANKYYQSGNYKAAIKTYQRLLFFTDDTIRGSIHHSIGKSYLSLNQHNTAGRHFEQAYFYFQNDSLKHQALTNKAYTLLLNRQFEMALIDLLNLPDSIRAPLQKRKHFYLGISYFGLDKFEKSQVHFKATLSDTAHFQKAKIDQLFAKVENINQLNPKTAKILSMILPGLGQFYVGDIKNGLNSLLLTSGFLALGIYTATEITVLDALIAVTPWYARYYVGGMQNAEDIAEHEIDKAQSDVYQAILEIITSHSRIFPYKENSY
jgi:tetratricopeptide (TPR) repeat protein